jgi:recombination protein RecA
MKKKIKVKREPSRMDELRALADKCNKSLGTAGAVYVGSEHPPFQRVQTGILALDYVTGGGLVKGQLVQFTGEESSFKTTAALISLSTIQRTGGTGTWVAGEGFDPEWAEKWGVDLDNLMLIQANSGDAAMETAVTLLESKLVDVLTLDSFQTLGTTREAEGGVDSESYAGGGAPQMWGRVMRRVFAAKSDTAIIGISQVRSPIGKRGFKGMPPEPEGSGIWALKHWKAMDIRFKKGEPFYEGENEKRKLVAREYKLRCIKNKTARSERVASFILRYTDDGPIVDNAETAVRLGTAYGLLEQSGSWVAGYGKREQSIDKFAAVVRSDPETLAELYADILDIAK